MRRFSARMRLSILRVMDAKTQTNQLKIFVAEDSAALRGRIAALLQSFGFVDVVGQAASVDATIVGIAKTRPDAAIIDFEIEGGTALDVLHAARQISNLRVAVLTYFTDDPYRDACIAAGAEYFLDKAHDFPRLRQIAQSWHAGLTSIESATSQTS